MFKLSKAKNHARFYRTIFHKPIMVFTMVEAVVVIGSYSIWDSPDCDCDGCGGDGNENCVVIGFGKDVMVVQW